jgi:hypothetical protein
MAENPSSSGDPYQSYHSVFTKPLSQLNPMSQYGRSSYKREKILQRHHRM